MKIVLVTPLYPPEIGGPATYAHLLMQEVPKHGHSISLVKFSDVAHLPPGVRHVALFFKVMKAARRADVVLAQDVFSVGIPSVCAARILGKPILIRVPGDFAWEQARQRFGVTDSIEVFQTKTYGWRIELYKKLERWVVNKATLVMTPSNYFSRIIGGWMKKGTPHTVYNGIDLSVFNTSARSEKKSDTLSIISSGRMVPWKGFRALIDVLVSHPSWTLTLVGDGPEKEALRAHAHTVGVSKRVRFTGTLPQSQLFSTIGEADVFVLNSSFESFSFQVVEVMALGVPVVATRGCNLEEIITTGKNGILIEISSQKALEDALTVIQGDTGFSEQLVIHAKERASDFSITKTIGTLLEHAESVIRI